MSTTHELGRNEKAPGQAPPTTEKDCQMSDWTPWAMSLQTESSGLAPFGMVTYNMGNRDDALEVTFYQGEMDGKPVIQVDGSGDFRMNVNDAVVFDHHTEGGESLIYRAALALFHTDVQSVDDARHFSAEQMHQLREELIEAGFPLQEVDRNGRLEPPLPALADGMSWGGGSPTSLEPGDQIIFSEDIGGEGEVLTVVSTRNAFGIVSIETEEKDFTIDVREVQGLFVRVKG